MSTYPTSEQNPNGLHLRYIITKTNGEPVGPEADYFVLRLDNQGDDPVHLQACRLAALSYADAIEHHLPQLARELRAKVASYEAVIEKTEKSLTQDQAVHELEMAGLGNWSRPEDEVKVLESYGDGKLNTVEVAADGLCVFFAGDGEILHQGYFEDGDLLTEKAEHFGHYAAN